MIASQASLPAVHELPHKDPPDSPLEVGCWVDDNWTFTSELQNAGNQVFGCLDCN